MVEFVRYLGDYFNTSGNNTTLCKERCLRAKGSTVELIALCKEIKFGMRQIENVSVVQSSFPSSTVKNGQIYTKMTACCFKIHS